MQKLRVHIVLDKSGSMQKDWSNTLEAVNTYVSELAADKNINAKISLTAFDSSSIDTVRDDVTARDFEPLTRKDASPGSMTPLLDAVGQVINELRSKGKKRNKVLVIMTDGLENASKEHTADSIKVAIEQCQKDGWLITYLGSDHNAWNQAKHLGLDRGNVADYAKGNEDATLSAVLRSTQTYAATNSAVHASFTDEQRRAMVGKLNEKAS